MTLDLPAIRSQFLSLSRQAIFLDNPGGTQIAQQSIDRINQYLVECNANHGGAFATSIESDAMLEEAHHAMADFYNAALPEEIIFGNNMTTLTLHISRSISREWKAGEEIVVTRLDHDANVTPWVLAAQDRGVKVNWVDFDVEDGTLRMDDLQKALERKPRLLAVGYASNGLGTINPIAEIIRMAHEAGTTVYVDAVQYAPHGPIDVQKLDCDFLVSSAYKFFGPHAGILYGKQDLLEKLFAYKVRPATNSLPGKFETGTQNHEGIAGASHAFDKRLSAVRLPGDQRSRILRVHRFLRKYRSYTGLPGVFGRLPVPFVDDIEGITPAEIGRIFTGRAYFRAGAYPGFCCAGLHSKSKRGHMAGNHRGHGHR